jgi:uncharacterized membrane protein
LYDVVTALHIMAVVAAFGPPLVFPLLFAYLQRRHPAALGAAHDVQLYLNQRVTGPGIAVLLVAGIYLASKADVWSEIWVSVPLVILIIIGGVGGALINPSVKRLIELAQRDITRADAPGDTAAPGDEYAAEYQRYVRYEILLGALVLVAIFFMAAKP